MCTTPPFRRWVSERGSHRATSAGAACLHALDVGYRHIDTAQLYRNEAEVGDALRETSVPREDIFVTTKVWRDDLEPGRAAASIEESLTKLDTYVDLLLIHWPRSDVPLEATLDAMATFTRDGRSTACWREQLPGRPWCGEPRLMRRLCATRWSTTRISARELF